MPLESLRTCWATLGYRRQQQWLASKLEARQPPPASQCLRILRMLVHADAFERFLAERFPNSKVPRKPDDSSQAKL